MADGARSLTVIRTPRVDKLSPAPTGTPLQHAVTKVDILPRQNYEVERGWVSVEGYDVWLRKASRVDGRTYTDGDILGTDTVKLDDGTTWSIDGPPSRYDKGKITKGIKLQLKRYGT